jgi:DNA primase
MQRLSDSRRRFLRESTQRYNRSLPGSLAEEYLESRGLGDPKIVRWFQLGYVEEPLPGHELYRGKLAIPYLRWSQDSEISVVSLRFRRINDRDAGGKYLTTAGDRPRLYNTAALMRASPSIAITEGELDAITAHTCGVPTVGVPGAQSWKPHFREPFLGYRDVFVLADGDEAGMSFANGIAKTLPNAKVIPFPPGEDVNSLVNTRGKDALLQRIT